MNHPIFEITMFWNEKSIFKERVLNTLEYARAFYIAEGNESHSGKIKRPFLVPDLLLELPEPIRSRVIHVPVDFSGSTETNPFVRERLVRDTALSALKGNPEFTDESILLIQDFDEFIRPQMAPGLEKELFGLRFWRSRIRIRQRLSYFKLNLKDGADWTLSLAVSGKLARTPSFSPNQWRHQFAKKKAPLTKNYYGWHHSYLGDVNFIRNKLDSFAEAGIDLVKNVTDEQILDRMNRGLDLYGRDIHFEKVNYANTDPIPALLHRTDLLLP